MTKKIASFDPDFRSAKQFSELISKALPDYVLECCTTTQDLIRCVQESDIPLVFIHIDALLPLGKLQQIIAKLRDEKPQIDIVLLYRSRELEEQYQFWRWAIQMRITSVIGYPYSYDELLDALAHTWFHSIPACDLFRE